MAEETLQTPLSPQSLAEKPGPLQLLSAAVQGRRRLLILTHDNPDPDALSSAAALKYLLGKWFKIRCRIAYGGAIVRPENRAMVQKLKIHPVPIQKIKIGPHQAIALVDTQPGFGNNSLPRAVEPLIVIDHHPSRRKAPVATFADLRPEYGATATILTEYLNASGLPIPVSLATALFYGIASETQDLGREAREPDNKAYLALFPKANKRILSHIRNAPVPRSYFQHLEAGLRNSFTYKNVIGTRLGPVSGQDIVPLIADLLLRLERISWSIVLGRCDGRLFVSIRTRNPRAHSGRLLRRVLGQRGSAGGHDMVAGGYVPLNGRSEKEIEDLEDRLIRKFMRKWGTRKSRNFDVLVSTGRTVPREEVPQIRRPRRNRPGFPGENQE
jgi:nanoRNase/pAp phosphatase (c-di-AMP/oligoRNAs hydrolase)